MGNKVGVSMVTLMDLNDAIIAGTAPTNPTEGTLWIDSSLTPPVLKKWSMGAWVTQAMDLTELDPDFTEYISRGVDQATEKLGNLSSDDKITATERQVILDKLTDMLGASPSGTVPLPAVATVNTYTAGEYYQTRKSATDAGVGTSDTAYTAYANAYTTLANYLNTILVDGIYCWDVSNAKVETVHTIVGQTFRDNWKAFYQAQLVLQTRTSKRVSDAKAEAEAYANSYREQLVGNGYAGVASNRNFSGFTYSTAQKVTGPGSFLRTATGETRTDEFIAIEPDRTYRLMVSVINSTTTGTHNIGLECYNAAGTSLGKRHILRSGTNNALPSTTSFVHYEGVISGLNIGAGAVTDTDFPAGTTQVKVYFNTNIGTTTNTIYVADVSFALETIEANKDYNGISLSAAKGMVVTSTKNIAEFNATDGIKVYKKTDVANPVFKLDSATGDLTVTGNINMMGGSITWANVNKPTAAQVGAATPDDVTTAVNNIKVGGTNLIPNSSGEFLTLQGTPLNWALFNGSKNLQTIAGRVNGKAVRVQMNGSSGGGQGLATPSTATNAITGGETYTISFWVRTSSAMTITHLLKFKNASGVSSNPVTSKNVTTVANTWTRYEETFVAPSDAVELYTTPRIAGAVIADMTFDIDELQVEKGNRPSDWSPAPEDLTTSLTNLEIGGTNLLLNSEREQFSTTLVYYNFDGARLAGREGKQMIISFDAKADADNVHVIDVYLRDMVNAALIPGSSSSSITIDGIYRRYSYSFTVPSNITSFPDVGIALRGNTAVSGGASNAGTYYIRKVQIEIGTKATDWSPAPEDAANKIIDLYSLTSNIGGVTVIDGTKIQTGTLDASKVNVTKLNASNITSGTINASVVTITNLNATNITGGTLNASVVSVTNLNASNITTGSMSGTRITANTLAGDRLVAGAITADKIAANTITASRLSLGATNLVNDPVLEAIGTMPMDASTALLNNGWNKGASTPTFIDDANYGRIMKYTVSGGTNATIITNKFYVDATKAYKVTFRFKYSLADGSNPTGSAYFGFNGYNSITSPSNEVPNAGSYEYITDSFSTTGTNPYFFVTGKGIASANNWIDVEAYLYPTDYYGDRTKLLTPTFPNFGSTKKVWFMGNKTNSVQLRFLNYNGSTSYGDGVSTNDLFIANMQVTEVDAGSLTATRITTGVLNADLVSISSGTAGVTINSSGVVANNATTGVNVTMNSTTGFEIKKSGATVFTVDSLGSLYAKNITIDGGTITWGTGAGKTSPPTPAQVGAATPTDVTNAVSAVQIGARNIFKLSSFKDRKAGQTVTMASWGGNVATGSFQDDTPSNLTGKSFRIATTTEGTGGSYWDTDGFEIESGKTYTVSFYAKATTAAITNGYIVCLNRISDNNYIMGPSIQLTTGWQRYSFTFTATAGQAGSYRRRHMVYQVNTYSIANVQLEEGNKMSAWSLNPDEILKDIDDVTVGGTNYAYGLGGNTYDLSRLYSTDSNYASVVTINNKKWLRVTGTTVIRLASLAIDTNVPYTWSFTMYTAGTSTTARINSWYNSSYNDVAFTYGTTPSRQKFTFVTQGTTEILHIRNLTTTDVYYFADFQLEKGNKATDWSQSVQELLDATGLVGNWKTPNKTTITGTAIETATITANQLAANTIAVKNLLVTDFTNLVDNGNFESDTAGTMAKGWTGSGSVVDITSFQNGNGSARALELQAITTGNFDAYVDNVIDVKPGDELYVEAEARYLNASGTGYGRLGFQLYDAKKTAQNSWQQVIMWTPKTTSFSGGSLINNGVFVVPAGVYGLRVWASFSQSSETSNRFYIDNIVVRRRQNANLIVDGAITANKISTNAITSDKIQAGEIKAINIASDAVTADKIKAGEINTAHLNAGAITAEKIAVDAIRSKIVKVGGSVTESSTEAGSSNGSLTVYDSKDSIIFNSDESGTTIAQLAISGDLRMTGEGGRLYTDSYSERTSYTHPCWTGQKPGDENASEDGDGGDFDSGNIVIYVMGQSALKTIDEARDGTRNRPFTSIQEAIDSVPKILDHNVIIRVYPFRYEEDLKISGFTGTGTLEIKTCIWGVRNIIDLSNTNTVNSVDHWTKLYMFEDLPDNDLTTGRERRLRDHTIINPDYGSTAWTVTNATTSNSIGPRMIINKRKVPTANFMYSDPNNWQVTGTKSSTTPSNGEEFVAGKGYVRIDMGREYDLAGMKVWKYHGGLRRNASGQLIANAWRAYNDVQTWVLGTSTNGFDVDYTKGSVSSFNAVNDGVGSFLSWGGYMKVWDNRWIPRDYYYETEFGHTRGAVIAGKIEIKANSNYTVAMTNFHYDATVTTTTSCMDIYRNGAFIHLSDSTFIQDPDGAYAQCKIQFSQVRLDECEFVGCSTNTVDINYFSDVMIDGMRGGDLWGGGYVTIGAVAAIDGSTWSYTGDPAQDIKTSTSDKTESGKDWPTSAPNTLRTAYGFRKNADMGTLFANPSTLLNQNIVDGCWNEDRELMAPPATVTYAGSISSIGTIAKDGSFTVTVLVKNSNGAGVSGASVSFSSSNSTVCKFGSGLTSTATATTNSDGKATIKVTNKNTSTSTTGGYVNVTISAAVGSPLSKTLTRNVSFAGTYRRLVTKIKTFNASYSESYHTGAGSWNGNYTGRDVIQSSWGGNTFKGCWFFGTTLYKACQNYTNITKVRLYVSRKSGGYSSGRKANIYYHKYTSKPNGNPTLYNANKSSADIPVGESGWVTLPSDILSLMKAGTVKGFGLTNSGSYFRASGSLKVEVTYQVYETI